MIPAIVIAALCFAGILFVGFGKFLSRSVKSGGSWKALKKIRKLKLK